MISKLATLQVRYIDLNKQKVKNPNGSKLISVKFLLQDPISSFKQHLLASYDGLQKGGVAQTITAKALKGKTLFYNGEQIDTARKSSLKDKGVIDGATLELKGYTALSRLNHVYSLSVYDPYHIKVTVDVTNVTTVGTLKHKLQNATGIHISEFNLFIRDRIISGQTTSVEVQSKKSDGPMEMRFKNPRIDDPRVPRRLVERDCVKRDQQYSQDGPETSKERNPSTTGHCLEDADCPATYFDLSLVSTAPVLEQGLLKISMHNFLWVNLAIALNIDAGERQCINSDHPKLQQKKLHMLLRWKEKNGDMATYQKIAEAAVSIQNFVLAENIVDIE